ncbi:MAG: glutamate-5-semialdehyde dehydrogenase [Alphaproteobacteria bacterium]|nr:glutamate-5-semialdehyde dehydrogenase [Alphaproteobacteria bacterium]
MALAARRAGRELASRSGAERSAALERMAAALDARRAEIQKANAEDVAAAADLVAQGRMSEALAARLPLSDRKIEGLVEGLRTLAAADDPIGRLLRKTRLGEGLELEQRTVPIGVLLVIFESRPDALVQVAGLAVKSGNGLLLKGGKEALHSNRVLHRVLAEALSPLSPDVVGLVETRSQISELLELDDVIDLVIPRGGNALVRHVQQSTRIPVLGHADGVCHVYVDKAADPAMAEAIVLDSKTDYPAACNAMETLLVHDAYPHADALVAALKRAGVRLYGGPHASRRFHLEHVEDFHHEYGDLAASVALVGGLTAAIDHIHRYGSGHTESIVTSDPKAAEAFLARVDSASVFHNVSTRFADGYRYGLGAEVGISTARIHARGPVGVEGLLTTRWTARGSGHTVGAVTRGDWQFTHERLV